MSGPMSTTFWRSIRITPPLRCSSPRQPDAPVSVGALAFAFVDPAEAAKWAGEYYAIIKSTECVPIGHAVNANIAMATGFSVHHDEAEAVRRGGDGFQFFGFALGHHYVYVEHIPGVTNAWERFERGRDAMPPASTASAPPRTSSIVLHNIRMPGSIR